MPLLCASTPRAGGGRLDAESETLIPTTGGGFDVAHALTGEGFDASEDGTGRGTPLVPAVAFALRGRHEGAQPEVHGDGSSAGALRSSSGGSSRDYVAFGWQNAAAQGMGVDTISPTLDKSKHPATATATVVRRLMPIECERLQGFPDSYTAVTYRGKPAADGPRYKSLGNSWAVPNVRWIGARIDAVQALIDARQEAAS